jgi:hypothetical protein
MFIGMNGDRVITKPLVIAFMLSVYHALIVAASNIDNAA